MSKEKHAAKSGSDYTPLLLAGGAGLAIYFLTKKKGGAEGEAEQKRTRLVEIRAELAALAESVLLEFQEMNAKLNTAVASGVPVEDAEMSREMGNFRVKEERWEELANEANELIQWIIDNWPSEPPGPQPDPTPWDMLTGKGLIPNWLRSTLIAAGVGYGGYRLYQWFTNRINKGGGKPPSVMCSICGGTVTSSDWDTMDETLQAHLMAYHPVNMGNALAVLPGVRADLYSLPYWAQGVAASEANMAYFYAQPVEYWGTNIQDNPWVLYALLSILTLMMASPAIVALIPAATATKVAQTAQELGYAFAPAG